MMEFLSGFQELASLYVGAAIILGSLAGIIVGVLPGVGPGVAIAVLLPLTYGMTPIAGITLLLGLYCGAFYGGAVTSILIRTPGEASSIMTMFDGYPMARRGEAERALSIAFMSSFIGGVAGVISIALTLPWVARFAGSFGAAEFSATMVLAMVCVARAYAGQFVIAAMMLGIGLFIGTVGIDQISNEQKFTFGITDLMNRIAVRADDCWAIWRCTSACSSWVQSAPRAGKGNSPSGDQHKGFC